MTEGLEPASLIESAQAAAAAGDYFTAERLLRDAAAIQEATLGSRHPDLASTLNNLALVCERTNKLDEAERGYRRAHAIAVESLGPRHPFVATSIKNLVEFCGTHGIPIWTPPASAPAEPESAPAEPLPEERVAVSAPRGPRTMTLAALAVAAMVIVFGLLATFWRASPSTGDAPTPATTAVALTPEPAIADDAPSPATPAASRPPGPSAEVEERPEARPSSAARLEARETRERPVAKAPVTLLNAQLCSALERRGSPDWQCTPAGDVMPPGTYMFYTRLQTNADTTIEHRWYRDDRVHQVMRLRVAASGDRGYRTYSSNTVSPERAGQWSVEVRSGDGTVLQEERFVVR